MRAGDCLDARAESGASEQDGVRAGCRRIIAERQEAPGHGLGEPAIARQIRRQAVVEQVHQRWLRPGESERGLDWRDGMLEGVDQGDAHG
jgi:hypothetical protein